MAEKRKKSEEYNAGYCEGARCIYEYTLALLGKGHTPKEIRVLLNTKMGDILVQYGYRDDARRVTEHEILIESGKAYLFAGDITDAVSAFIKEVKENRDGLCIAREDPTTLIAMGVCPDLPIIWLTSEGIANPGMKNVKTSSATDFTTLLSEVHQFLEGRPNSVILFEGVEYIKQQAEDFNSVLKVITSIKDKVYKAGASLILYVDREAVEPGEFARLRRAIGNLVE